MKILARNKKAYADYIVIDKYEAGIQLLGWEVKSIRNSLVSLTDGFVKIQDEEAFLHGVNISKWKTQSVKEEIDPIRVRKLLLNKVEIQRIAQKSEEKGFTLVPLQFYLSNNNKIKVEVALVKGKKQYDKRQKLKEKDMKRQIEQDLRAGGF